MRIRILVAVMLTTILGCSTPGTIQQSDPATRLNDIWVLTELNGSVLDGSNLTKGLPTLEFHIRDHRITGHGSCNNIMGSFTLEGGTILFGPVAGTRMACPEMGIETDFLASISGKTLRFTFDGRNLVLSGREGNRLVLKKVD